MFVCTVPTYNSCNECVGTPGIIHDCKRGCNTVFRYEFTNDLTIECSFDSQATWASDAFGMIWKLMMMTMMMMIESYKHSRFDNEGN